jgi:hypothetical protein
MRKKMFADNNERKKQQLISEIKSGLGVNIMKTQVNQNH